VIRTCLFHSWVAIQKIVGHLKIKAKTYKITPIGVTQNSIIMETIIKNFELQVDKKPNGAVIRLNDETGCVVRVCAIPTEMVYEPDGTPKKSIDITMNDGEKDHQIFFAKNYFPMFQEKYEVHKATPQELIGKKVLSIRSGFSTSGGGQVMIIDEADENMIHFKPCEESINVLSSMSHKGWGCAYEERVSAFIFKK
jgi:hypothetical protein